MSQPFVLESKLFDPAADDAETAAFNERIEKELASAPPLYRFKPQVIRDARAAGHSVFGPIKHLDEAQNRVVKGPAGDIPVRVFIPEKVTGVYLHIHGGGFMLGSAEHQDEFLAEICKTCQVACKGRIRHRQIRYRRGVVRRQSFCGNPASDARSAQFQGI